MRHSPSRWRKRIFLGCRWGESIHEALWIETLTRIGNPISLIGAGAFMEVWDHFRRYPAILLFYSAGVSCIVYDRYDNLAAITTKPLLSDALEGTSRPIGAHIYASSVMDSDAPKCCLESKGFTPLMIISKTGFGICLRMKFAGTRVLERHLCDFEYLLSLIYAELNPASSWVPSGNFPLEATQKSKHNLSKFR